MNSPYTEFPRGFSAHALVWLVCAFAVGIFLSKSAVYMIGPLALLAFAVVFLALAFILNGKRWGGWAALFGFVWLGALCYSTEQMAISSDRIRVIYDSGEIGSGESVIIKGTLVGSPEPAIDGVFAELAVESLINKQVERKATGVVRLFVPLSGPEARQDLDALSLRHGVRIETITALYREDSFLNPGVTPRRELLDRQQIDATGTVKSPLLIEVKEGASMSSFAAVFELRNKLISEFNERFSRQTAGVLIAAVLGDKYFLDRETAETFRAGGTFHILVISGLHMTFIGGLILLIVRRFTSNRWLHFVLTSGTIWAYTLSVGAEPPAVRASLMITMVLLGHALYSKAELLNSLAATALLLLIWRPSELFNPSFQLTIVSVFSIIGIALPLISRLRAIGEWVPSAAYPFPPSVPAPLLRACETLYWNPEAWRIRSASNRWWCRLPKRPYIRSFALPQLRRVIARAVDGLLISAIVQLSMLPLLIYYFHRMPAGAVILNLFVGVLMAAMSVIAVVAVMIAQTIEVAAWPLLEAVEAIGWIMYTITGALSGSASRRIPIYSDAVFVYAVYLLPVTLIAYLLYKWRPFEVIGKRRRVTARILAAFTVTTIAVFGSVLVFHPFSTARPDGRLTVEMLDVGQGDAALITFPNGETMLVDGGGRLDFSEDDTDGFEPDRLRVGEMVVSEFLWERGLSRVDHIVASHADADHIQGLTDVAKNFEIGNAYFAAVQGESSDHRELAAVIDARAISTNFLSAGDKIEIGGAIVSVLYPAAADDTLSENDRSLVLEIRYGQRRFLLTGDIETEGEKRLVSSGATGGFDVIKVPHHGSRTSSTNAFVNWARPQIAVIPVGRRSMFGHPHPEVVERWRSNGVSMMTTGERGTVRISTNGEDLETTTYMP
jgi:competence protein ComEC